MTNHDSYLSPFSWRYGSPEMRTIWGEVYKRKLWRRLWVALAEAQAVDSLVSSTQIAELRANIDNIDIQAALIIEAEIHHDLMAEVRVFASQCPTAGGIIHLGATSMDIEDNAEALRLREALALIINGVKVLLRAFCEQMSRWADQPCMGFTHIQPAEPTTIGYRLAQYAQDLLTDLHELNQLHTRIRGKGFKGAVGTSASYGELVSDSQALEQRVMQAVGLSAFVVATQIYPRKQDWLVLNTLAGVAGSIYKFALDLRLLQSPPIGEWAEPFGAKQVGSSAMPFKRNPIRAERLCSLGREVAALPRTAWDNAAHSMLERTLDDSANRRTILPEAFLAVDEMLQLATGIITGLQINQETVARNLKTYGTFSAVERVLMALGRAGADRQTMHEILREHSMAAWQTVIKGGDNPLVETLLGDNRLAEYLNHTQIQALMDAGEYVGDAPQRTRQLIELIHQTLEEK